MRAEGGAEAERPEPREAPGAWRDVDKFSDKLLGRARPGALERTGVSRNGRRLGERRSHECCPRLGPPVFTSGRIRSIGLDTISGTVATSIAEPPLTRPSFVPFRHPVVEFPDCWLGCYQPARIQPRRGALLTFHNTRSAITWADDCDAAGSMLEYAAPPSPGGAEWPRRAAEQASLTEASHERFAYGMDGRVGARCLAAAALALALGAVEARADHIFTLSGVTFDDGTSATGTFTTNDALTSLVNFDITTTNGAITGFNYTPATADPASTSLPAIIVLEPASLDHIIQLTFDGGLTLGRCADLDRSIRQFRTGRRRYPSTGHCGLVSSAQPPSPSRPRSPWPGPPPWCGWGCRAAEA